MTDLFETILETILVAALVGLGLLVCVLVFLIRLMGRDTDRSEYVERCRACQAELKMPNEPCPRCGRDSPSAERQGGDLVDENGGE